METINKLSLSLLLTEGHYSCLKASKLLETVSHDHLTRLLNHPTAASVFVTPVENLPPHGAIVVDDSVIAKPYAKEIEGISTLWSSAEDRLVTGMSVFLALWVTPERPYLLYVSLPGETSKHDVFQALLKQIKEAGLEPEGIYFDNWYAKSETLNLIDSLGWTYVTRMKSNRLFAGKALKEKKFWGAKSEKGRFKGVKHKCQVVKHGDRFLATNVLHPTTSNALAASYAKRWVIETVFRALKSVHHLEKCQCRSKRAQFNHLMAALQAFIFLAERFPHLGPELAQREFIQQYRTGQLKPEHILTHAA